MASAIQAPKTSPAPAVALPSYRQEAFARSVSARLREGATPQQLMREQQALATALSSPVFAQAMATAYAQELALHTANAEYSLSPQAALHQVQGILANRVRDAQAFEVLLGDPAFLAHAQALPVEAKQPYDIPAPKKQEIVERLSQIGDQRGAEPAVHIHAAALGHRMVHMALANIFKPNTGPLTAPLSAALAAAWPDAAPGACNSLAKHWLKARHDPAHSLADGLKENGELYLAAMASIAPKTPAVTIAAPAIAEHTIEPAPTALELH